MKVCTHCIATWITTVVVAVSCITVIVGCKTSVEQTAYRTLIGAKAFLDSEKGKHPECASQPLMDGCPYLTRATAAKDFLIDSLEVYCAGGSFETSGKCNPPTDKTVRDQLAIKLKAAIDVYERAESDLKGVIH